ncbi:MAG: ATPase domain-containing protein [bacterium]
MIERIKTGIITLDEKILDGGIPIYSVNIISGCPGSGKTIFSQQILYNNACDKTKCIYFTTLSEPTAKVIRYQQAFDYFDEKKIQEGLITYVDIGSIIHKKGLSSGIETIINSIEKFNAKIIAIDSFKAISELAESPGSFRRFAYSLCVELIAWRCTSFLIGEYSKEALENDPMFAIADGIICFDSIVGARTTRRTISIIKMRGVGYFEGNHSLSISSSGISVFPRIKTPPTLSFSLSEKRVSTGISGLDSLMEGGALIGSSTLIAGTSGTGKTTFSLNFLMEGIKQQETVLLVSFQEPPDQLKMIAKGFGFNLEKMIKEKKLFLLYASPVEIDLDEHGFLVKEEIEARGIKRVVIDSLRDIELSSLSSIHFRDHIYSLVNFFKSRGITSMLTYETIELFEKEKVSACGISFITDNLILLSYQKEGDIVKRMITLLKMRGSEHKKEIKEFEITKKGVMIK